MQKLAEITAAQVDAITGFPLTFDPEQHRYFKGPVELPSLSVILKSAGLTDDFSGVPEWILEHKRQIGQSLHKCIELYFAGTLDRDSIHPDVLPYYAGFEAYVADHKPSLYVSEAPVCSIEHWVACKPDLVLVAPLEVTEFKTTLKISRFVPIQLAGQALCIGETAKRTVCQLKKDGTYKLVEYTDPRDFEIVKAAARIYKWKGGIA